MLINEKNIKFWSTIGPRATFGMASLEYVKQIKNLMILTCDVSTSAGLDRFRKTFPDNYLDLGIAEQNMIGVAAGLASEGYNIVTTTFAPFQTMRCCEQIKVNVCYMKQKICMVGLASGLVLGNLGFTHCCIEDIGVLRSIPGIIIISPSDCLELVKSLEKAIIQENPVYIRLTGGTNNPIINHKDYDFKIGKSVILNQGKDVALFCNGAIVNECLKAAKMLEDKNISCKVINMHTVKPIDEQSIKDCKDFKLIVSIEEHNIIGGLGSAISEYKSTLQNMPEQLFIGINDIYSKGGSYQFLLKKHGLDSVNIYKKILKKMNLNE